MAGKGLARTDRVMRTLHLYTGLFLIPWMVVYAISALVINHGLWFREKFNITPPEWKLLREVDFIPADDFPKAPAEQAKAILKKLDLDGPHRIQGHPDAVPMVIFRICAKGNYRITWRKHRLVVAVEQQQPFSYTRLVNFLHFKHGYGQHYAADIAWGIVVDLTAVSMLIWVVSGAYLWYRRSKKYFMGLVCVIGGIVIFAVCVICFCR